MKAEIDKRLSVFGEMPGTRLVMLDRGTQVGIEDLPGEITLDFTDENLIENSELSEEDAAFMQSNEKEIVDWVRSKGFRISSESVLLQG